MATVHSIAGLAQNVRLDFELLKDGFAAQVFKHSIKRFNLFVTLILSIFELFFLWKLRFHNSIFLHLPKHSTIKRS